MVTDSVEEYDIALFTLKQFTNSVIISAKILKKAQINISKPKTKQNKVYKERRIDWNMYIVIICLVVSTHYTSEKKIFSGNSRAIYTHQW